MRKRSDLASNGALLHEQEVLGLQIPVAHTVLRG